MEVVTKHLSAGARHNHPQKIVVHAIAEIIHLDQAGSDYYDSKGKHIPPGDYPAYKWLRILGLSAHHLYQPAGPVIQCRYDGEGAYHAKGHNTDSLGAEFLVKGVHDYSSFLEAIKTDYLTESQYADGLEGFRYWMDKFEISKTNVIFHSYLSPDRKHDPGEGFLESGFMDEL